MQRFLETPPRTPHLDPQERLFEVSLRATTHEVDRSNPRSRAALDHVSQQRELFTIFEARNQIPSTELLVRADTLRHTSDALFPVGAPLTPTTNRIFFIHNTVFRAQEELSPEAKSTRQCLSYAKMLGGITALLTLSTPRLIRHYIKGYHFGKQLQQEYPDLFQPPRQLQGRILPHLADKGMSLCKYSRRLEEYETRATDSLSHG